jgi:hypothetical protein
MNKNLILTGWSKNGYLAGAAAAIAALKGKADVAGVSMDALAGALTERGPKYSAVYVLGVGLTKNIQQILAALKLLKKNRVKTVWLSGMRVAPEFAAALSGLNRLILLDIYPAREEPIPGVSSEIIFRDVTIADKVLVRKEELMDTLAAEKLDVLVTFGAGNIDRFVEPITKMLESR